MHISPMLSLVVVVFLYLVVCCKRIYKKKSLNWKKVASLKFDPKYATAFGRFSLSPHVRA